jgi:hypothetical protein
MSDNSPEEFNYGRKAGCFTTAIIGFILFAILCIWIYSKNGDGLPM